MPTEVEKRRPYETALLEVKGRVDMEGGSSAFEVAANVADKILTAESVEAVIAAAEEGPEDLSELVGVAFNFVGESLQYLASAEKFRDGGTGYYIVFSCRDTKGNDHTITTGATNVFFQMKQFEKLGVFDGAGALSEQLFTVKSRETGKGTLYWISFA